MARGDVLVDQGLDAIAHGAPDAPAQKHSDKQP